MNRRERRQRRRDRARVEDAIGRVLYGACRDCHAVAVMVDAGANLIVSHIVHDAGCPAGAGVTPWAPVKPDPENNQRITHD